MASLHVSRHPAARGEEPSPAVSERLYSLDVFRGLTMIWMFSNGFGLHFFRDHAILGPLERQFTHEDWHGYYPWDMIQPFFMFIVGVAMPFAFAHRDARGESRKNQWIHVVKRCALLVLLGTMARSIGAGRPVIDVINVLGQLSFTYLAAYLLLRRTWRVQLGASLALLGLHTALHFFVNPPGVTGPWDKDANFGWWLDGAVLGKHWGGGYATLNCLSSASATMWGMMAGVLLRSPTETSRKYRILILSGIAGILLGTALDPVIPNIKKIWTASFAFSSGGITLLTLALFHWMFDGKGWRRGTGIISMVGANSIFIYLFHEILYRWMRQTGLVFTGWAVKWWGPAGSMLNEWLVIGFQIYLCYWLYQRRIFFKL
jgi:predicted acyltransferase